MGIIERGTVIEEAIGVQVIKQAGIAVGAFVDDGGASGHYDLTVTLPAGAVPLAWKAVVNTGFTGNVSAVLQAGVSGDVDRFSAVVDQSVFAAGTVGASALGQTDSLDGIGAAQTVRLTVTANTDFTAVTAGNLDFYLYYMET